MLDIDLLRNDLPGVAAALAKRGVALDTATFEALERERKDIQTRTQELQAKRNALSKQIGIAKGKGEDASALLAEVAGLGDTLKALEAELDARAGRAARLPARCCRTSRTRRCRTGTSADDNVEVRRWGTPRTFDFPAKDHADLGEALGLLDFATAAKLSGARFSLLRGDLARLHRALAQLMLDVQTREHGYVECYTPYVVNAETLVGTTQLPKFEADMFSVRKGGQEGDAGADVPDLDVRDHAHQHRARRDPRRRRRCRSRLTAHTPCFRSEAGSYGKDTRGMIRQHQFDKVEMVQIVHPERSYEALEEMTRPRRDDPRAARASVPRRRAVHRRHRLRGREDLRPRGLAARARTRTARSARARTARRSRRGACRRASATRRASPSSCTR